MEFSPFSRIVEWRRILCLRAQGCRKASVIQDRQNGDDRRQRPRSDHRPQRQGGPSRGPRPQSQPRPDDVDQQRPGPRLPDNVEAKQLAPEVRRELTTLDKATADYVAKHLVVAGDLLEEDPEAALEHARAARGRASRIAGVREAVGIAAYHCGDWAQALSELRAARRMGSKSPLLPLIADCERGVGRPERAVELARSPEAEQLTGDDADELRIVVAGARCDLGQAEQALALLSTPPLDPRRTGETAARLFYVYAEILLSLGRRDDAVQWFLHAASADVEGATDAEDRVAEFG
jgi:tetratricopeptide (TPR) repeat protein